jgi:hypothetical protein
MNKKISFADISISLLTVLGAIPLIVGALSSFLIIRMDGQTTKGNLEQLRNEVKDSVQRSDNDHDRLIQVDTNLRDLSNQFYEFKKEYKDDIKELKELIKPHR